MIIALENNTFDTCLVFSDWRYAASAVGIMRFLSWHGKSYRQGYKDNEASICYNRADVTGKAIYEDYLSFAEYFFMDGMHHLVLKSLLQNDELTEEQIKLANEKLKANTVMSKVFASKTYSSENKDELLRTVQDNRFRIIFETFKNAKTMYEKYANPSLLFSEHGKVCRLNGYYVDTARKTKSLAYRWDYSTFVYEDEPEFDFVPFGFTNTYPSRGITESYFINNNTSAKALLQANNTLNQNLKEDGKRPRTEMFARWTDAREYIDYDVEVISKGMGTEYYETLFVRRISNDVFRLIGNFYKWIGFSYKLNDSDSSRERKATSYPVEKIVTDAVLNLMRLDQFILFAMKYKLQQENDKQNQNSTFYPARINALIYINQCIYIGGASMSSDNLDMKSYEGMSKEKKIAYAKMKSAQEAAEAVKKKLRVRFSKTNSESVNKVKSYQQKLISCLSFHDYDRFCETLLQLSAYAEVPFAFADDLFMNFEANKNVAYVFVNTLGQGQITVDSASDIKLEEEK